MAKLVLDKDAYGSRGQLSLLADFFELCCCVLSKQISHKTIVDYLLDRRIRVPIFDFVEIGDADDTDDSDDHTTVLDQRRQNANEDATRILSLIVERSHYLGDAYPFVLRDTVLLRRSDRVSPYDVTLSFALRHGCLKDPTAATDFEEFVERCLRRAHWNVFALGKHIRSQGGSGVTRFRPVFKRLAAQLRARPPADASVPRRVHDRGADVVARWDPADDRPGCRTMLVQVTVGKAETWAGKASEPPRGSWSKLLGDPLRPLVALAVPHHVELSQLRELVENGNGATVLDRLRLVAHEPLVTRSDRAGFVNLRTQGVEW